MTVSNSNRTAIAIGLVLLMAAIFWLLILSPKRKESGELANEVVAQQLSLSEARGEATEALAAKKDFPTDYRKLVTLGKAVPEGDETASLLVSLTRIAGQAGVKFESLTLNGASGESTLALTQQEAGPTSDPTPVPPTEAEAALLPLGATVGSANLAVIPYSMKFSGSFFQMADFIRGVNSLIRTHNESIRVNGRLLTLDAFSLTQQGESVEGGGSHAPELSAEFAITAYVAPPAQASGESGVLGAEAGSEEIALEAAAPEAPAPETAETTAGTPSSFSTGEAR